MSFCPLDSAVRKKWGRFVLTSVLKATAHLADLELGAIWEWRIIAGYVWVSLARIVCLMRVDGEVKRLLWIEKSTCKFSFKTMGWLGNASSLNRYTGMFLVYVGYFGINKADNTCFIVFSFRSLRNALQLRTLAMLSNIDFSKRSVAKRKHIWWP